MAKWSRGRTILFYAILVCVVAAGIELMAEAAYRVAFGEWFSYRKVQALRAGLRNAAQVGPVAGGQLAYWVLHPYYGFVTDPEPIGSSVNEFGFFGHEDHIQRAEPDKLVVAVLGGSVATQFALEDYSAETLKAELRRIPAFAAKRIVILNLGNGSYKQPQGLIVVNDIIARGGHIDVLIALDGFNEIALPEAQGNVANGISPFFPQSWRQLVDGRPSRSQMNLLARAQISADARVWLAVTFSKPVLRRPVTTNLLWRAADMQLAKAEMHYRAAAEVEPPLNPDSKLSNDKRGFLGRVSGYASRRELYVDIARSWARSSILLNNIMANQGGFYIHALQPSQYLPGSKPLTANERRTAFSDDSLYKAPVETGYPYLRVVGQKLGAAGIWFEDLTDILAQSEQDLYADSCCHLNKAGYDILARRIVAALEARIAATARSRAVGLGDVDVADANFSYPALRAMTAAVDYRDGSETPLRRTSPLAATADPRIRPEGWHAMGGGSYRIRGDDVTMEGPNQLFTVRDCPATRCKVSFSVQVRRAEGAQMGVYFINDKGRIIAEERRPLSGGQAEARMELVAPTSTRKVRAFLNTPSGVVEFGGAALAVEGL